MTSGRPDGVPPAIHHDALLGKSRVFVQRALTSKARGEHEAYQLWAALALEVLGKAALASVHPCLVANPEHQNSIFAAAGVRIGVDIRTITARTVYKRLRILSRRFDQRVMDSCIALTEKRNSELHSGASPFSGTKVANWEAWYWYATDLILKMLGMTFDEWIGPSDAKASSEMVAGIHMATREAVRQRIAVCSENVALRPRMIKPEEYTTSGDHTWTVECPACESGGEMVGVSWHEQTIDTQFDDPTNEWYDLVETQYSGEEFLCPFCNLHLDNYDELDASGIETEYSEEEYRVAEFVAEYNNE